MNWLDAIRGDSSLRESFDEYLMTEKAMAQRAMAEGVRKGDGIAAATALGTIETLTRLGNKVRMQDKEEADQVRLRRKG